MATTYNPIVHQNATWEVTATITQANGDPFVLTDFTGQSQIKDSTGAVLASPVVTIVDALNGVLKVHMSTTQTASLPVSSTLSTPKPPLPVWDVLIGNDDASQVYVILSGTVTVRAGVTTWTV